MPVFHGKTNETLIVKLQSLIMSASWGADKVSLGGRVSLEVRTVYVSEGSALTIIVKNLEGKTIETIQGKIFSNTFRTQYKVSSPDCQGGIRFYIEMNAHSLKGNGPILKVLPPIQIRDFVWKNGDGVIITSIEQEERLYMEASIRGPMDGTPSSISLFYKDGPKETVVFNHKTEINGGKVSVTWMLKPHSNEAEKETQRDLNLYGGDYEEPSYQFEVECLGTRARSPEITYASWIEFDMGSIRGKVEMEMPDGSRVLHDIPDTGVLRIEKPKVGSISIVDVQAIG